MKREATNEEIAVTTIGRNQPTDNRPAAPNRGTPQAPAEREAAAQGDTLNLGIATTVVMRNGHAEVAAYEVHTDGSHLDASAHQVESLPKAVQRQIVGEIAKTVGESVAAQIQPVLEEKLATALDGQSIPHDQVRELARALAPKITADVVKQVADALQAEVGRSIHLH